MGFPLEAHCPEHAAGTAELPCPWPDCAQGATGTTVTLFHGATLPREFRRRRNTAADGTSLTTKRGTHGS